MTLSQPLPSHNLVPPDRAHPLRVKLDRVGQIGFVAACRVHGIPALIGTTADGWIGLAIDNQMRPIRSALKQVRMRGADRLCEMLIGQDLLQVELESSAITEHLANIVVAGGGMTDEVQAVRDARAVQNQLHPTDRIVTNCHYLGGTFPSHERPVDLVFRQGVVQFFPSPSNPGHAPLVSIEYAPSFELDIGGPGQVRRGGGFIGGGFGLKGAFEGMAMAYVLNKVTTRTTVITFITITDRDREAFFVTNQEEPSALRISLSPIFAALRSANIDRSGKTASPSSTLDPVTRLKELAELHRSGVLSDDEFAVAKTKILSQL